MKHEYFLYPLLRWRLYSSFENGVEQGGMSDYVQLFTIIAIFVVGIVGLLLEQMLLQLAKRVTHGADL